MCAIMHLFFLPGVTSTPCMSGRNSGGFPLVIIDHFSNDCRFCTHFLMVAVANQVTN